MPDKINPICIHPMFGPGTKTIKGQNIISVPIKDAKKASYEYNKMQDKIPALSDFRNPKVNSEDFFEKFFVRSKGDDFVASYSALDDAGKQVIKNTSN